jgi:hypothetical protein
MQIDLSDEQFEKEIFSIRDSLEPASKPTVIRCLQYAKQKMTIIAKWRPTKKLSERPKYRTKVIGLDAMRNAPQAK